MEQEQLGARVCKRRNSDDKLLQSGIGSSSVHMDIARWSGGASYYFNGSIAEVEIYNGALTGDWIKAEYLNQSAPNTFATFSVLLQYPILLPCRREL